ncbi:hypothetical protein ABPG72_022008 [Tetrahymena utriculariae]
MIIRLDYSNFVMGIFYVIFGALFYFFLGDASKYNSCGVTDFLNWSKYTYIVCFVVVAILVFKYIIAYFTIKTKFLEFYLVVDILGTIAVLVCAIALVLKDSQTCGNLHILAMVFYIFIFAFVALALIFFIYNCLSTRKDNTSSSGYVSVSFSHTSYTN